MEIPGQIIHKECLPYKVCKSAGIFDLLPKQFLNRILLDESYGRGIGILPPKEQTATAATKTANLSGTITATGQNPG